MTTKKTSNKASGSVSLSQLFQVDYRTKRQGNGVPTWVGRNCIYAYRNLEEKPPKWARQWVVFVDDAGTPMVHMKSHSRVLDKRGFDSSGDYVYVAQKGRYERIKEVRTKDSYLGFEAKPLKFAFKLRIPINVIVCVRIEQMSSHIIKFLREIGRYNTSLTDEEFKYPPYIGGVCKLNGDNQDDGDFDALNTRVIVGKRRKHVKPHQTVGDIPLDAIMANPEKYDTRKVGTKKVSSVVALARVKLLHEYMKLHSLTPTLFARKFDFPRVTVALWAYFRIDIPKGVVIMLLGLLNDPDLEEHPATKLHKKIEEKVQSIISVRKTRLYAEKLDMLRKLEGEAR